MNRHERRAASKTKPSESQRSRQPERASFQSSSVSQGDSNSANIEIDLGLPATPFNFQSAIITGPNDSQKSKRGFVFRVFAKIMLSKFILSRISHPEIENILYSIASQSGRQDVMDELLLREKNRTTGRF